MRVKEGVLPRPHCGWQRQSRGESVVMDLPGAASFHIED